MFFSRSVFLPRNFLNNVVGECDKLHRRINVELLRVKTLHGCPFGQGQGHGLGHEKTARPQADGRLQGKTLLSPTQENLHPTFLQRPGCFSTAAASAPEEAFCPCRMDRPNR